MYGSSDNALRAMHTMSTCIQNERADPCLQTEAALRLVRPCVYAAQFDFVVLALIYWIWIWIYVMRCTRSSKACGMQRHLTLLRAERGCYSLGRAQSRYFQSVAIRSNGHYRRPLCAGCIVHSQKGFDVVTPQRFNPPPPPPVPLTCT